MTASGAVSRWAADMDRGVDSLVTAVRARAAVVVTFREPGAWLAVVPATGAAGALHVAGSSFNAAEVDADGACILRRALPGEGVGLARSVRNGVLEIGSTTVCA